MKKNVLTLALGLMLCSQAFAQQVGIGTNAPDASAKLDIASGGTMGILFPRVALTATNVAAPVTSPANWLTVFNTATAGSGTTAVVPGLYYWNGTAWVKLDTGSALGDWKIDGNSNGALRYLGTNDAFDLGIETNGAERMRVTSAGRVGIGTTNPSYTLTLSNSATFGYGNGNATYSSRTETRANAGLQGNAGAQSGFFETDAPAPAANWYTGASGWQHLLDIRHSNDGNNYAMQLAGSFFDQNLWFRKTNGAANTAWSRILTTLDNGNFIQNQYTAAQTTANYWVSGNGRMDGGLTVGAGGTIDNNNTNTGTVSAGALAFGSASGEGIGSKRNAGGNQYGLDFYTNSVNRMVITQTGNVGIGTTATPAYKLDVNGDIRAATTYRTTATNGNILQVGDDAWISDVNSGNTVGIQGQSNSAVGVLQLGSSTNSYIYGTGGSIGVRTSGLVQDFNVGGRMYLTNGVIQTGGAAVTGTSDLGLYSRTNGSWIRIVTNNAPIRFFQDDNTGTNPVLSVNITKATRVQTDGAYNGWGIVPIGSIMAWTNHITGTPALPDGWKLCDGTAISDADSPMNGQTVPNLNSATSTFGNASGRYLRGSTTSGTSLADRAPDFEIQQSSSNQGTEQGEVFNDGSTTNYSGWLNNYYSSDSFRWRYKGGGGEVRPLTYTVLWIIRIK